MDRSLACIDVADLLRLAVLPPMPKPSSSSAICAVPAPMRPPAGPGPVSRRCLTQLAVPCPIMQNAGLQPSKFGPYPGNPPQYSGRRLDLLGPSLPAEPGTDSADALRPYPAARD